MAVTYEWLIETVDEHGDIQEVGHHETAESAIAWMKKWPAEAGMHYDFGIVRDTWAADDPCDLELRQWAYVEDGKLPTHCCAGAKVPVRFHDELARALA